MEIWKEIENFPGYFISNYGNVKSVDRIIKRTDGKYRHYRGRELKKTNESERIFVCKFNYAPYRTSTIYT